jgi:16S rRNA A1518/A1519 N6-dimethyltransferase RsmA/KsgA/DIM1 with predicted DNA glycosylase/AP lyase activity
MELDPSICRQELEANHLIPRKYHGQVFTTDPGVIGKFIETVQSIYRPGTKIVEIGGGLGYLTEPLIRHFNDIDCLEIDDDLFNILYKKFIQENEGLSNKKVIQNIDKKLNNNFVHNEFEAKNKGNAEYLNKNFIQNTISRKSTTDNNESNTNKKIIQKNGLRLIKEDILNYNLKTTPYLLVGNIPFHLSGRLYRKFMSDLDHKPYGMVFITDKQYATTLMGQPPRCYRVSLQAQAYGKIEIVADVPPASVYPPPKVTCCIMKITHSPTPLPPNFWKVVNYHYENFPTKEVESPKTLALRDWIALSKANSTLKH